MRFHRLILPLVFVFSALVGQRFAQAAATLSECMNVHIPVGLLPDSGLGPISFRDYDFTADAYLRCTLVPVGDSNTRNPAINPASLAAIRRYADALQKRDMNGFLDSCFPLPAFEKDRAAKKAQLEKHFSFWASRFKEGVAIAVPYALPYDGTVFYLLLQNDPASPGGIHHAEVVETKAVDTSIWRCAVGEFAPVKNSIITSFLSCATKAPAGTLPEGKVYEELPLSVASAGGPTVTLLLPRNQEGENAERIRSACAVAKQFASVLNGIADKGKIEGTDTATLKEICSSNAFESIEQNVKSLESPLAAGNSNNFKTFWRSIAQLYTIGSAKCVAIPLATSTTLWVLDPGSPVRQITVKKEGGKTLICGIGAESQDLADFLNDSAVAAKTAAFIDKYGVVCAK